MIGYSLVNSKGQVTIPSDIRKKIGIKPGEKVVIKHEDGKVSVAPVGDFKSFRGSVPAREVPADFDKLRQEFVKNYLGTPNE